MNCEYAVETFSLLLLFFGIASGAVCYAAEFSEDIWSCPDFDNQKMKCDTLQLGMIEGKEAELGLNGDIELNQPIEDGMEMGVEIWKVLDIGKEFLYHMQGDICSSIQDKTTPWYPMIQSMKIIECPIETNIYSIKDMSMSLNHSKDMMTHEMCGDYVIQLSLTKPINEKLSCYELAITVSEYDC